TKASQLSVSAVNNLEDASLSYCSLTGWEDRGLLNPFLDLTKKVWRTRAFGAFWSYMLVAEGAVDFAVEPELALHDMGAFVPILREYGGKVSSVTAKPG